MGDVSPCRDRSLRPPPPATRGPGDEALEVLLDGCGRISLCRHGSFIRIGAFHCAAIEEGFMTARHRARTASLLAFSTAGVLAGVTLTTQAHATTSAAV